MKRKTMLALMLAVSMTCSMGAATTAMAADDSATEESADESTEAADTTEASDEDQKAADNVAALIDKIYVAESMLDDEEVIEKVRRFSWESVENGVFRQMCDTQTPQGILTVLRQPSYQMQDLLKEKNPLIMVLEDLQDPGNAGTIIRTGEGAGVSGVFLTKTCVDITNPKVIRATMGSVYRIPFLYVEDVVSLKQQLQDRGIRFFAAHLQGKNSYDREDYKGGTAFLIGNEGKGLTDQAAEAADCLIRIPMCGQVESLNAAMAAGILMYEAARQRRN